MGAKGDVWDLFLVQSQACDRESVDVGAVPGHCSPCPWAHHVARSALFLAAVGATAGRWSVGRWSCPCPLGHCYFPLELRPDPATEADPQIPDLQQSHPRAVSRATARVKVISCVASVGFKGGIQNGKSTKADQEIYPPSMFLFPEQLRTDTGPHGLLSSAPSGTREFLVGPSCAV